MRATLIAAMILVPSVAVFASASDPRVFSGGGAADVDGRSLYVAVDAAIGDGAASGVLVKGAFANPVVAASPPGSQPYWCFQGMPAEANAVTGNIVMYVADEGDGVSSFDRVMFTPGPRCATVSQVWFDAHAWTLTSGDLGEGVHAPAPPAGPVTRSRRIPFQARHG